MPVDEKLGKNRKMWKNDDVGDLVMIVFLAGGVVLLFLIGDLLLVLMLKSIGKVPYDVLKCALVTECKSVKSEE